MKHIFLSSISIFATSLSMACGPNYLSPIINWYEPNKSLAICGEVFYEEKPIDIYKKQITNQEIQKHYKRSYEKPELAPKYTEEQTKQHAQFRENLRQQYKNWNEENGNFLKNFKDIPKNLPLEILYYEIGALLYSENDAITATQYFKKVLSLPEKDRLLKTIPSAYMVMRCEQKKFEINYQELINAYNQLNSYIQQGFADPQKLAFEADGYLAMYYYQNEQYMKALQIYLDQYNSTLNIGKNAEEINHENSIARNSISMTLAKATNTQITELASDTHIAEMTTANIIIEAPSKLKSWFKILTWAEKANVNKFNWNKWAGKIALTFYNKGDFDLAKEAIQYGNADEPLIRWVNAKLMIMQGDIDKASQTIAELIKNFSTKSTPTGYQTRGRLPNGFFIYNDELENKTPRNAPIIDNKKPKHAKLISEYGLIKFDKGDYFSALDCFLQAGYYLDAAFVCEVVLSLDELKNYADARITANTPDADFIYSILTLRVFRETNSLEGARKYYKAISAKHAKYITTMQALDNAIETTLSSEKSQRQKAIAHWEIFTIICNGASKYFASYFNPNDANIYSDKEQYETEFVSYEYSSKTNLEEINTPTANKIKKLKQEHDTNKSYLHLAFNHALKGADLMDDVWLAGRMYVSSVFKLKYRDPKYVELAYKNLIKRCPETPQAKEAKKLNWFPKEIEDPNVILKDLKK